MTIEFEYSLGRSESKIEYRKLGETLNAPREIVEEFLDAMRNIAPEFAEGTPAQLENMMRVGRCADEVTKIISNQHPGLDHIDVKIVGNYFFQYLRKTSLRMDEFEFTATREGSNIDHQKLGETLEAPSEIVEEYLDATRKIAPEFSEEKTREQQEREARVIKCIDIVVEIIDKKYPDFDYLDVRMVKNYFFQRLRRSRPGSL